MNRARIGPGALARSCYAHRHLIWLLTKRAVVARYQGSVFGLFWALLHPLLLLVVYTFVFGLVLKARWPTATDDTASFAVVLFAGLLAFNIFAESTLAAPTLVISHSTYVKRVVFPLEILPIVSMGAVLFQAALGFSVLLIAAPFVLGEMPWTFVSLPIVIVPLVAGSLGVAWFLAALGVYLRDMSHLIGLVTTVLLFTTPIFYPIDAIPANIRVLFALNPLAVIVEQVRSVALWGELPSIQTVAASWLAGGIVAWMGFVWFQKSRKGFADVV